MTNRDSMNNYLLNMSNEELAGALDVFCSHCPCVSDCCGTSWDNECQKLLTKWLDKETDVIIKRNTQAESIIEEYRKALIDELPEYIDETIKCGLMVFIINTTAERLKRRMNDDKI